MKVKTLTIIFLALFVSGLSGHAQFLERAGEDYRTNWSDVYESEDPMISTYAFPVEDNDPAITPIEDGYLSLLILGAAYTLWKRRKCVREVQQEKE
ncbi:MAG: hypothetical protein ACRC6V_18020 [Bacteroidales bacterium]